MPHVVVIVARTFLSHHSLSFVRQKSSPRFVSPHSLFFGQRRYLTPKDLKSMAPTRSDLWKTVISPFVKLTETGVEPAPPGSENAQPANSVTADSGGDPSPDSARLNASEGPMAPPDEGAGVGGNPPTEGTHEEQKHDDVPGNGPTESAPPAVNKPPSKLAAIASHIGSDGKSGGSNSKEATPNFLQSAFSHPPLSKNSPSHNDAPPSSSNKQSQPTSTTTSSSDPTKHRRQSVVLPSYEPEMLPDNTVVPESSGKQFLQKALYTATSWLWKHPAAAEEPRRPNILERLIRTPHTIRRIAVIGVHGWFPGRFLQRVVGEPTGTSGRFAEKMGMAVRAYFSEKYNIVLSDDAITLMPLEGEGKVERRVDILYRQLVESDQGWRKKLLDADMIFVAAHSQGTPVSALLLSRLIKEGLIDSSRQKVAFLAMAGITHGPYPALKTSMIVKYFEADAARELFEFNDANSDISKKYHIAMRHVLSSGLRVVAVGSWYDQVVPLYSAVMHGFHHPNIYRALYVSSADYVPDFLSHLVVFGLKLRNAGLHDHNLVVHLSDILTGNLYGFGTQGHSAIYEETNTYMLAVAWAMGGKPNWSIPPLPRAPSTSNMMVSHHLTAPHRLNPYYLPWIMARLIDDPRIRANEPLKADLDNLLNMFEMWEPQTKQLKEMRYRLEPLRSRL